MKRMGLKEFRWTAVCSQLWGDPWPKIQGSSSGETDARLNMANADVPGRRISEAAAAVLWPH